MSHYKGERGNNVLEFALATTLLVPLMLGVVWAGITLGRGIQITQLARDAGHMYAQNIDFSEGANQDILVRLALGTNMTRTSGNTVIILSQIKKIYDVDCAAASVPLPQCTNRGSTVFIHRLVVGNSSLRSSNFGTPLASLVDPKGSIAVTDYLKNKGAVATNFDQLFVLQQGEWTYVAEGYLTGPNIEFFGRQSGVYAISIF